MPLLIVQMLMDLIREQDFEVFVHPIPPVLKETRPVVKAFAALLKKEVQMVTRQPAARGRLHYLDFFDDLLTVDGQALASDLGFDGTHMSPAYLRCLRSELNKVY